MLRVGRCKYDRAGERIDPSYPGFRTVVVLTRGTNRWGGLGPYELRDETGAIMENVWQFSKIYPAVDKSYQRKSRFENVVVWDHPAERHMIDAKLPPTPDNLTPEYWNWRRLGFAAPYAVRYPPGFGKMDRCAGALIDSSTEPVGYIPARKLLYVPLYTRLAKRHVLFRELQAMLSAGKRILIAEVDGPHQESADYYTATYGAPADFINRDSVAVTEANMQLLLNDARHPFGHGYCLAAALADIDLVPSPQDPIADIEAELSAYLGI